LFILAGVATFTTTPPTPSPYQHFSHGPVRRCHTYLAGGGARSPSSSRAFNTTMFTAHLRTFHDMVGTRTWFVVPPWRTSARRSRQALDRQAYNIHALHASNHRAHSARPCLHGWTLNCLLYGGMPGRRYPRTQAWREPRHPSSPPRCPAASPFTCVCARWMGPVDASAGSAVARAFRAPSFRPEGRAWARWDRACWPPLAPLATRNLSLDADTPFRPPAALDACLLSLLPATHYTQPFLPDLPTAANKHLPSRVQLPPPDGIAGSPVYARAFLSATHRREKLQSASRYHHGRHYCFADTASTVAPSP